MSDGKNKTSMDLSRGDWLIIAALFVIVVTSIYWLNALFNVVISQDNNAAIFIGAIALAASAYSTISANRIKKLEISKGFDTARSIVLIDVTEALSESQDLLEDLNAVVNTNKEEWNRIVSEISGLEDRYVRRQDHVVFLSTHFTGSEFLSVQKIYLQILKLFRIASNQHIEEGIPNADVPASIERRKSEMLKTYYVPLQKKLLRDIQELNIGDIPEELLKRLTQIPPVDALVASLPTRN